jgi:hypothetical protein
MKRLENKKKTQTYLLDGPTNVLQRVASVVQFRINIQKQSKTFLMQALTLPSRQGS